MNSLAGAMADHRPFLWGLCYRMTGVAADADDLVQETFARALAHPPERLDLPLRPWLTRIALNAARDALRRRRRTAYAGPWLPSPVDIDELGTDGRYEHIESLSFAFLVALEALSPQQRAVLLLRDVFDYSVDEAAEALSLSPSNVKTTHHRARKRMEAYDRSRLHTGDGGAAVERNQEVLGQLLQALLAGDASAVEGLLSRDVMLVNDGAGEFHVAKVPLVGPERVAQFLLRIQTLRGPPQFAELRVLNRMPALVAAWTNHREGFPPRMVFRVEVDEEARIREVHGIFATRKLTAVLGSTHRSVTGDCAASPSASRSGSRRRPR